MNISDFFDYLWKDYVSITPQAEKIHNLFGQHGEKVINDHVAFRTFSHSPIDLNHLEPIILKLGYRLQETYTFTKKKLVARSYSHPEPGVPRIFLSELQRHLLSDGAQAILRGVVSQVPAAAVNGPEVFARGLLWQPISFRDYKQLLQESEYAAWLACMGLRANHFTVSLNHLQRFTEMEQVIELLERNDFAVNQVGGAIKGKPENLLVQSSSLADKTEVCFAYGHTAQVPSCFYEFAKRYPSADGALFEGFIADNADKIFESTHAA
ncbi:DUF1338 domain-containing protein [Motiliproteus sp. SC1-56]|uniref:DUF1338 domain-containing protein n=1 Tax=Motiliproteus sp. SC1-56 TaxID=2799565 RepID=UPI001A8D28C9|nr:DUF1338 domain-containing protein [Motiliproteus sp. SC1-56]